MNNVESTARLGDIAIIGMAGRFPGADNIAQFWQNLKAGVESVSFFSDEELEASGVGRAARADARYVRARAVLEGAELFDAAFFGYSPREAEIMDPQHRLFLEACWTALESAGYDSEKYEGRVGVYAGTSMDTYLFANLYSNPDLVEQFGIFQAMLGHDKDFLTTRVSYKINLNGPSIDVQTACSTSLVAAHLACQSLINGECDIALAGGVSVKVPQKAGYVYQEGGIMSPDGHCRAFDSQAQGFVGGNGVGVVVLKRLSDALSARDTILAVIKGSALNNDGSAKVGYTAPSINGQADVIAEALAVADIHPSTIGLIETHGSGTPLGDSVEVAALVRAFGKKTQALGSCAIGSVKTNIGHLDAAAGVAGLIKAALALQHKTLPPSLNFEHPNPKLDLPNTPFYVPTQARSWQVGDQPRRAGVSSFGIGGTNAHIVLEEAPPALPSSASRPWKLLLLSAKTTSALETATNNLAGFLQENPEAQIADVAYTLQVGRRDMSHRRMLVCREHEDALQVLLEQDSQRIMTSHCKLPDRRVVFMFPGQGVQHINMGLALYQSERRFREQVDRCADLLRPILDFDIRSVIYPSPEREAEAAEWLKQTSVTQPALFVIEYALAKLWMEWGLIPEAMIGYSIGEYVAACLADVFSLQDALQLVASRGQMMQALPAGAMLSVPLSSDNVQALLDEEISLAGINGPRHCVVSGPVDAVTRLERQLADQGVACRFLHTSHAFHSSMMEPVLEPFADCLRQIRLKAPKIPFISNLTGTWADGAEVQDPQYWVRHLREPVRFSEGMDALLKEPDRVLLEVGPGRSLSTLTKHQDTNPAVQPVLCSLPDPREQPPRSEAEFLLDTLGRLWLQGIKVNWPALHEDEERARIPLPTYPFDRLPYWVAPRQPHDDSAFRAVLTDKVDSASPFYVPTWTSSRLTPPFEARRLLDRPARWLLFVDPCGIGTEMAGRLSEAGQHVTLVTVGPEFARLSEAAFSVNPHQAEDYKALMWELQSQNQSPEFIVHLWSVTPGDEMQPLAGILESHLDLGFYSLLFLAEALAAQGTGAQVNLGIVSNNMQHVAGDHQLCPGKAAVLGPCRVIPQEIPHIICRSIDLLIPQVGSWHEVALVDSLIAEMAGSSRDPVVALHGGRRWVQAFEPVALSEPGAVPQLRDEGVYLITGGLGGIGLSLAEHFARTTHAKLVLVGRSDFPDWEDYAEWLSAHGEQDTISQKINRVRRLEQLGAEVLITCADVTDAQQMQAVIARTYEQFGTIHGVVHAAGIPGTHMIQRTSRDSAAAVLAPKVQGTLVLHALLENIPLDFFVLCSSQSSILGGIGGMDYCAANAFLDAFAHHQAATQHNFTVAINWDRWLDVGMGVTTPWPSWMQQMDQPGLDHPWLDRSAAAPGDQMAYLTRLSTERDWVVNEHRIGDYAVMPGTGYLELARAALEQTLSQPATEMHDVTFISPLIIAEGQETTLYTTLSPAEEGFEFNIASQLKAQDGAEAAWRTYATGRIGCTPSAPAAHYVLEDILRRCGRKITPEDSYYKGLGQRWQNIQWISYGEHECLACLELPERFSDELAQLQLHPSLVDMAAGILADLYAGDGDYVPFNYGNIAIKAPLGQRIYSYVRYSGDKRPTPEMLLFDIVIMDEQGEELVSIDSYAMRRTHDARERFESSEPRADEDISEHGRNGSNASPALPGQRRATGIISSEGVDAFSQILSARVSPQVVVSAQDFSRTIAEYRAVKISDVLDVLDKTERRASVHARPVLRNAYIAPRTDAERAVAQIFQDVLGLDQVGVNDNFFELGGDSLIALQLLGRLRQTFDVEMPLQSLFEKPTVVDAASAIESLILAQIAALSDDEASALLHGGSLDE